MLDCFLSRGRAQEGHRGGPCPTFPLFQLAAIKWSSLNLKSLKVSFLLYFSLNFKALDFFINYQSTILQLQY